MRHIPVWFAIVILAATLPVHSGDRPHLVRFGGAYVVPTGDLTEDGFFVEDLGDGTRLEFQGDLTIEAVEAFGPFVSYEYRLSPRIGLEAAVTSTRHDVDGTLDGTLQQIDNLSGEVLAEMALEETATVGDVSLMPLTLGLNVHLLGEDGLDLYVGPVAGYVWFGDLEIEGETVAIDDDVTFGAVLGLDVPLGDRWIVGGAVRYLAVSADLEGESLGVDPWVVHAHAGVRF